jgi:hypothetical protein
MDTDELRKQLDRFDQDDLSADDLALVLERAIRRLVPSCPCKSGGRCCARHQVHVIPHVGCILR